METAPARHAEENSGAHTRAQQLSRWRSPHGGLPARSSSEAERAAGGWKESASEAVRACAGRRAAVRAVQNFETRRVAIYSNFRHPIIPRQRALRPPTLHHWARRAVTPLPLASNKSLRARHRAQIRPRATRGPSRFARHAYSGSPAQRRSFDQP